MAQKWWQFTDWTGDGVEIWEPGTPPKPCTVFRAPWLNQFIGWARYVSLDAPGTNPWPGVGDEGGLVIPRGGWVEVGAPIQSARFWNKWLRPNMHDSNDEIEYMRNSYSLAQIEKTAPFEIVKLLPSYDEISEGGIIHPGAPGDKLLAFLKKARVEIDKIGAVEPSWHTFCSYCDRRTHLWYYKPIDDHMEVAEFDTNNIEPGYHPISCILEGQDVESDQTTDWPASQDIRCYHDYYKDFDIGENAWGLSHRLAIVSEAVDRRNSNEYPYYEVLSQRNLAPSNWPTADWVCHEIIEERDPQGPIRRDINLGLDWVPSMPASIPASLIVPGLDPDREPIRYAGKWQRNLHLLALISDTLPTDYQTSDWPPSARELLGSS